MDTLEKERKKRAKGSSSSVPVQHMQHVQCSEAQPRLTLTDCVLSLGAVHAPRHTPDDRAARAVQYETP
ncbi:hypothetical protein ACOMHN_019280 [Nucella lapillus]